MKKKNFLVGNVLDSMDESSKGTILRSMAIFTAIELSGSFLRGIAERGHTKKNFMEFCTSQYMHEKYHSGAELLYKIFRCGVAHSYRSKGGALLSSDPKDRRKHLSYYQNGVFIYVPTLDRDVRRAIRKLYKDIKRNDDLEKKYWKVIKHLDKEGIDAYNDFITRNKITPKKTTIERDIAVDFPPFLNSCLKSWIELHYMV